ncbi:hypothetical protein [Streptococcus suis]|uniref:hypothetical protein n=1 Tax=Streptococcus suis TaxID=1307 RepID=UPI000CF66309|nr:hypothetical protein [Streptococcus suis]
MNKTIENVKITKTFLGREDHGILTCYLTVEGDGFGVSIGGYCLDKYDEHKRKRVAYHKSFELIDRTKDTKPKVLAQRGKIRILYPYYSHQRQPWEK